MSRSYLYVPGDQQQRFATAATRGADALLFDLEDAVAPARKQLARQQVRDFLASGPPPGEYWVRINNDADREADVAALAGLAFTGICLPKASVESLAQTDALLSAHGADQEWQVAALLETASGILEAPAIAVGPRVSHLAIGESDLAADLGVGDENHAAGETIRETAMTPLRMQVVVASAAAGLPPPTGPVSTQWADLDELRRSTQYLAGLGFGSRAAVHPAQLPVINAVFTPTAAELEAAEQLVRDYDAARASGAGVLVAREGAMVDEAVIRHARRVIDNARRTA